MASMAQFMSDTHTPTDTADTDSSHRKKSLITSISNDCLGHMMTFLTVSDTAVCGRTCQAWLQVAYYRTPKKSFGATFSLPRYGDPMLRITPFITSPHKRHFNKCYLESGWNDALDNLCANMAEITEFTYSSPDMSGDHLPMPLSPLLRDHEHNITRLTFIGVALRRSHLEVIKQLSSLVTLEVLLQPRRWRLEDFQTLCLPENQLSNLRDFRFDTDEPLSIEHLNCFKALPVEAFTMFTSVGGMTKAFVHELDYFKYCRNLLLYIYDPIENNFDIMCEPLKHLPLLDTISLCAEHFHRGQLASLFQHQSHLTSLTLSEVSFESPECLSELPQSLVEIKFSFCATVDFDHLVALAALPCLERLTHYGRSSEHTQLTLQQQRQLSPPHSRILPHLKELDYDWENPNENSYEYY